MIQDWANTYGPNASGEFADQSYWLATENCANQNYPTNRDFYTSMCRFFNEYVPLFGVVGYGNVVYYAGNYRDEAIAALNQAIESFDIPDAGPSDSGP